MMCASGGDAWPDEVVERAVDGSLVLVVGAGVSRNAVSPNGASPPSWDDLINSLITASGAHDLDREVKELISQARLLDAAELLRSTARSRSKEHDLLKALRAAVDGTAPNNYAGGDWHSTILRLEPRIIVTTNYDKILERASTNGYSVHSYDSKTLAGDVRRGEPVLVKIHGTVDQIDNVILAQSDYTRMRVRGSRAAEVLQSLFLTRVALFVGYSLRDPDIRLLLENVLGGREEVPAHYILADGTMPEFEAEILRFSFGVTPIRYPAGRHELALEKLKELAELVEANRVA
jgi:hypothetical protein